MGLIMDGTGIYSIKDDGTKEYATPISAKINGEELYTFDSEKGNLRISMSPKGVENLRQSLEGSLEKGICLEIPDPFGLGGPARFKGVKSIDSLPKPVDKDYLISISGTRGEENLVNVENDGIPQKRKTLLDKLRDYFN